MKSDGANPDRGAFEPSLVALKQWREEVAAALADLRRWAIVHRLTDDHAAARLAHLERRLASERLSIAFVAEFSRGKSELINALFFADLGARLLPSGAGHATMCPTEILYDPSSPIAIRLLPIETRGSPRSLREFLAEADGWKEIAIDPGRPESLATAFDALFETLSVTASQAHGLGLPDEAGPLAEIPRWRYAIVNFPNPLLAMGLTILDAPGLKALDAEPELAMHRLQEADAVVFMLSAETGPTPADLDLWRRHVEPMDDLGDARYVVINRIDTLRDGVRTEAQVFSEIDRQVRATADALGVDPTTVYPLSARQGLAARIGRDGGGLAKSRLYRLEQALAGGLVQGRRLDQATSVRAEVRTILAEARALLDSRRAFVEEQLVELGQLQGKNQKLVDSLGRRAAGERLRIDDARTAITGLRAVHNRHADDLAQLLSPEDARASGVRARAAVLSTAFSAGIGEVVDGYFRENRERIARAVEVIGEVKAMMATVNRRFAESWGLSPVEVAPFSTDRFLLELDRLEEQCSRNFRSASSLLTRGRSTLAALFFDTAALKAIHVFEIADREVRAWMNSFIRPLEAQVNAFQEQANSRIEGMARIQDAESGLAERIDDLRAFVRDCDERAHEWKMHDERLARLLDPVAEAPFAPPR
ncbi:MAG TPA: dynamin family protein [Usitatibacteraceae bacterium]|nr:dynamin family protein [Usitatibacteraceae bacterium]